MPKVPSTSTHRRRVLVSKITEYFPPAMRPCSNCEKSGNGKLCKMGASSERCSECVRKNSSGCSLTPFSPAKWDRIRRQRVQKQRELREAFVKITRLQTEVAALEEKELNMVNNEVDNIADLEQEEALVNTDLFPFDVSSETVEFPPSLNWSPLVAGPSFVETVAPGPGSSQGS